MSGHHAPHPRRAPLLPGLVSLCLALGGWGGLAADVSPAGGLPLKVGITPDTPPMICKQDKVVTGVEAELAQALGSELGRPVRFVEVGWDGLVDALLSGKVDIIMSSMSITPARQGRIAFTVPYLKTGQMALARADEQYRFALGFPKSKKVRLGVKKGTTGDLLARRSRPAKRRPKIS